MISGFLPTLLTGLLLGDEALLGVFMLYFTIISLVMPGVLVSPEFSPLVTASDTISIFCFKGLWYA